MATEVQQDAESLKAAEFHSLLLDVHVYLVPQLLKRFNNTALQ